MIIKNKDNGKILATNAWTCRTLKERCKGLMFTKITEDDACVLVSPRQGIMESSIHMMFVPQDLYIVWADEDLKVVGVRKCKKGSINPLTWRAYYPDKPAKYVIEVLDAKGTLKGDRIQFIK